MDLVFIAVLVGIIAYEKYERSKERNRLLDQIKVLNEQVYFTKTHDFLTHESLHMEEKKEETAPKEEEFVPLDQVDPQALMEALHGKQ